MKITHAMSGLVIVGVGLVVLSLCWTSIVGGRAAWSKEQAREHAELSAEGHRKMHEQAEGPAKRHKGDASKSGGESREEIQHRYEQVDADLQRAKTRGHTTALVFRWLGAVLTMIGGVGYFVLREKE